MSFGSDWFVAVLTFIGYKQTNIKTEKSKYIKILLGLLSLSNIYKLLNKLSKDYYIINDFLYRIFSIVKTYINVNLIILVTYIQKSKQWQKNENRIYPIMRFQRCCLSVISSFKIGKPIIVAEFVCMHLDLII